MTLISGRALTEMSKGKSVVLVSGTNGKTTTTGLVVAILKGYGIEVATNALGANMTAGIVTAIADNLGAPSCVFEVDEHWLASVASQTKPSVVVLLNLSRDQLDRTTEVRVIAKKWKNYLQTVPDLKVVANADDPLVAYCATEHKNTVWISGGNNWLIDARSCPNCGNNLNLIESDEILNYLCSECSFTKPEVDYLVDARDGKFAIKSQKDSSRNLNEASLNLPGAFNGLNAAFAIIVADLLGFRQFDESVSHVSEITQVAGRYSLKHINSFNIDLRLILAKNPAGWAEALKLVNINANPVIFAVNAEIPDGKDTSWLYDVPFEVINSKFVLATGKRVLDLAARLAYADADYEVVSHYDEIFKNSKFVDYINADANMKRIDLVANYSAFQDLLKVDF